MNRISVTRVPTANVQNVEKNTPKEFCEIAFAHVGLNYEDYVKINPKFLRPAEVNSLLADPSKAKEKMGWQPKTTFKELVEIMTDSEMTRLREEKPPKGK